MNQERPRKVKLINNKKKLKIMNIIEIENEMIRTKNFLESIPKLILELKEECECYEEEYDNLQMNECDSDEYYDDELTELSDSMSLIDRLIKELKTINNKK
jgi:hypothetical protein